MCLPQGTRSHDRNMQEPPVSGREAHQAGHLKQYLAQILRKSHFPTSQPGTPRAPAAPKAVINYINGGPSDEEYDSRRKRQKLWDNHFPTSRSHPDTATTSRRPHLVPGNRDFDVRRILVDPGSSADLVQASVVSHMGHSLTGLENPGRILSGFNGSSTTSLGDIVLPVQAGPVTLNVQFSVVQELSPFNIILGRTWLLHESPPTYHQMVSFLTNDGQIDLYGSQLAARQCYR
ncbi:hypothetical protein CK203_060620 [Vitis vinifera]|uniref:Uncharacterized protein n=1 Tax=Vitis vinifera TaxID=29760 RepID=A0A438GBZ3_VITVI|nr:hypothetical protein CK203_060620 [Vitis vinifera]